MLAVIRLRGVNVEIGAQKPSWCLLLGLGVFSEMYCTNLIAQIPLTSGYER